MTSVNSSHLMANNNCVIPYPQNQPKTWTFPAQALNIIWGGDERYWHIQGKEAEMIQVCWVEVTGSTKDITLQEGKKYEISFKVSLKQGAFGWDEFPIFMMAKVGKRGKSNWRKIDELMKDTEPVKDQIIPKDKLKITFNASADHDKTIYFGLYEVWSGKWKGGLIIHEAIVEQVD